MADKQKNQRSKEVSHMIKQGFIDPSFTSSPSRSTLPRASPSSSPSRTPSFSTSPLPTPPSSSPQTRSNPNPTLSQMMSAEQQNESTLIQDRLRKMKERINVILSEAPFRDPDWDEPSDVKLVLVSKDGFLKVQLDVQRRVLVEKSGLFANKLVVDDNKMEHNVEILDCDDIETFVEVVVLMYCDNLKKRLLGEGVERVLRLLVGCSDLKFAAGKMSCLAHLEAIPWTEEEQDKVLSVLGRIEPHANVTEVLQRLSSGPFTSSGANGILLQVMNDVRQAKDEKARREMKSMISGLLIEEPESQSYQNNLINVSKEVLNQQCQECLSALIVGSQAVAKKSAEGTFKSEIAREADDLLWVVEILIDKDMGDQFVRLWADQKELADLHQEMPQAHRYVISKVTAHLCTALSRGLILVSRDARFSLLRTWLKALYADFGWMRKYDKSFDRKVVEEGIGQTVLTLSLAQQQDILLEWFKHFADEGDDCLNLLRAFGVWWRRAFLSQNVAVQE